MEFLKNGSELFDDDFVAWQFGPVIEDVYFKYCGFGASPIYRIYNILVSIQYKKIMDKIIEEKRELPPWDLVEETHKVGGAWEITFNGGRNNIITKELIREKG